MLYFSDLHMRPESEDTCFAVLEAMLAAEAQTGHAVGFLGDFWHVRYSVPVYLLNRVRETLKRFRNLYILPGNHDQYDVAGRHALEVFQDLPNVRVFSEPTWDVHTGCWLPYRKHPEELARWVANNPRPEGCPDVAHLHHGIVGASMNNHAVAGEADGLHPEALPFARVYCGHWHRHQTIAQCVYVGSQWQTRSDESGQVKGMVMSDTAGSAATSTRFQFIPVNLGPAFHRVEAFTAQEIAGIHAGDTVRVPSGTSAKMVKALTDLGAEVFMEPAAPAQVGPRLGVAPGAPLRTQAEKYVGTQTLPEGFTAADLMAVFDEVANG
jgi:hypothetical protein